MEYRELQPHDLVTCERCGKTEFAGNADKWNAVYDMGVCVCFLCPDCQTTEEYIEAEVNEATIDYSKGTTIHNLPELLELFRPMWDKALQTIADGEPEKGNAQLAEYLERFRKGVNALYRYDLDKQLGSIEDALALLQALGEFPDTDEL